MLGFCMGCWKGVAVPGLFSLEPGSPKKVAPSSELDHPEAAKASKKT